MTTSCKLLRMCVACRLMKPKSELIKVTKSKSGSFAVNNPTAEGRSAYVCKNAECLKKCRKTKGFNKAFKGAVPDEVYNSAEELFGQER